MTYRTELEKIEQPLSAELYDLTIGGVVSRFTSHSESVVYESHVYLARPIKRTGFSIEKSMKTVDVTVSTPVDVAFGEYLSASPYARTTVEITKVFLSDPDTLNKLIFSGLIYTVSVKNGVASALFKSANGLLSRKVPRVTYQSNCNWSLFSEQCGIQKSLYKHTTTVNSIDGNILTLDNFSTVADKKYQGGTIAFGVEERLLTNHSGSNVTLLVQFPNIAVGDTVHLYPGCDGSPTACASFNNQDNFMGMPNIPTRNALLWGFR